jgi:hypothetical protein
MHEAGGQNAVHGSSLSIGIEKGFIRNFGAGW